MTVPDLVVLGLGPAGRALAHRAAAAGLDVVAVDPAPDRVWSPTYAAWSDELPAWLEPVVVAARVSRPRVWAVREHVVDREYAVLDNHALHRTLALDRVRVVAGRARPVRGTAVFDDGTVIRARTVVDARGVRRSPELAEQTAYGVIVAHQAAALALGGADALFMDWRTDNGAGSPAPPSFLYAIPLGGGRWLLEETCLVGRPALPLPELRSRLRTRLAARGLTPPEDAPVERVHFPVQAPRAGTFSFGARGGLAHPGTGYSVAASLASADAVVAALVAGDNPTRALWPRRARAVRGLREVGLRALLALPPEHVAGFFEEFFSLPVPLQRAYLSGRDDPATTTSAMWRLFRHASMPVRRTLIGATLPIPPRSST